MEIKGTFKILTRGYLGPFHVSAALLFARQAKEIEHHLGTNPPLYVNLYAAGAVNSSVAFLEATINELMADCYDEHPGILRKLSKKERGSLRTLWKICDHGKARVSVLDKYDFALEMVGRQPFDRGREPWGKNKDSGGLTKLSDALCASR